jgi:hypothetical protein
VAAHENMPDQRSSSISHTVTDGNAQKLRQEMDPELSAAINDDMRAAIENASALTERATIELADLERRITEFRNRLGRKPR